MSLYAIGDLHLHFASELKAPGQLHGRVWKNHEDRFRQNCLSMLRARDTLVLAGDHSWGKNLREAEPDLQYIADLPGEKILLRGNHDMFWDAKKTAALNERFTGKLHFLQNNFFAYKDIALVGTKGHAFEGPFFLDRRGRVTGWDEKAEAHSKQLVEREAQRLEASFEAAKSAGYHRFFVFLHYPPTDIRQRASIFTEMAEDYGAEQLIYAHCHGAQRFHDSLEGMHRGVLYSLVSGDYLNWVPLRILP